MRLPPRPKEDYSGIITGLKWSITAVITAIALGLGDAEAADESHHPSLDEETGRLSLDGVEGLELSDQLYVLGELMESSRMIVERCLTDERITGFESVNDPNRGFYRKSLTVECGGNNQGFEFCTLEGTAYPEKQLPAGNLLVTGRMALSCVTDSGKTLSLKEVKESVRQSNGAKVLREKTTLEGTNHPRYPSAKFIYRTREITQAGGSFSATSGPDSFGRQRNASRAKEIVDYTWEKIRAAFESILNSPPTPPDEPKKKKEPVYFGEIMLASK